MYFKSITDPLKDIRSIADPLKDIRYYADPLKDIRSSFQRMQKQLENSCRLPEVITNFSVTQLLDRQVLEIANSTTRALNRQTQIANSATRALNRQTQIANSINFPEIIINSPLVKMEKMNKQFAELFNAPNIVSELSTKSILYTLPSINFPDIIIPRPTDNSIFPLGPEERRTPSPETDSTTFIDDVYETRIPLEKRRVPSPEQTPIEISQRVLIVGSSSLGTKQTVARFIEHLGLEAIILSEQPNGGRTKFEKFKAYTNVDFAISLFTPDDVGRAKDNPYDELKPRPAQDTIFEHVYLSNHLQPEQVFTLCAVGIELPSYLEGLIHVQMCSSDSWKLKLVQEMQFAGLRIDANKLLQI